MDISGLVNISIGMFFLGPRFRITRIYWLGKCENINWIGTTKIMTAVTSKSGARLRSFTLCAILVPNMKVFVMDTTFTQMEDL